MADAGGWQVSIKKRMVFSNLVGIRDTIKGLGGVGMRGATVGLLIHLPPALNRHHVAPLSSSVPNRGPDVPNLASLHRTALAVTKHI